RAPRSTPFPYTTLFRSKGALTAPAAKDVRERAGAVWGWDVAARLLPVAHAEHGVQVSGLASPPDLTRGGRDDIVLVVNGRPVREDRKSTRLNSSHLGTS